MSPKHLAFTCKPEDPTDPLIQLVVGSDAYGAAQNSSQLFPEEEYKNRPKTPYVKQQFYSKHEPALDSKGIWTCPCMHEVLRRLFSSTLVLVYILWVHSTRITGCTCTQVSLTSGLRMHGRCE